MQCTPKSGLLATNEERCRKPCQKLFGLSAISASSPSPPDPLQVFPSLGLATANTTHQYRADVNKHPESTFAFAQKHLDKGVEGRKTCYDHKASYQDFQVGNQVWYCISAQPTWKRNAKPEKLSRKLRPHWSGPYLITDKLSPVTYQIKINKGQMEPTFKWLHQNQIELHKPFMGLVEHKSNPNH